MYHDLITEKPRPIDGVPYTFNKVYDKAYGRQAFLLNIVNI